MSFFVKKLEWEYGEKFDHVFYPTTIEEFRTKLQELTIQAKKNDYPFYVELYFMDDSYIGLIVGHELSCFYFGVFSSEENCGVGSRTIFDSHHDPNNKDDETTLEYSYKGDHGEKCMKSLIPSSQVMDAVYQYISTQKFPSYIQFSRKEFIDGYIN